MKWYSTIDITKALNIPRERLRDWIVRGFVTPTISAKKQGKKAYFSKVNIIEIVLFDNLLKCGLKRKDAAEIIYDSKHSCTFLGLVGIISKDLNYITITKYIHPKTKELLTDVEIGKQTNPAKPLNKNFLSIQIINMAIIENIVDNALKTLN